MNLAKGKADPVRTSADIELRSPQGAHVYRYRLHRLGETG